MYMTRRSSDLDRKLFLHVLHAFLLAGFKVLGFDSYFILLRWSVCLIKTSLDAANRLLPFLPFQRTMKKKNNPLLGFLCLELCGGIPEHCHLK